MSWVCSAAGGGPTPVKIDRAPTKATRNLLKATDVGGDGALGVKGGNGGKAGDDGTKKLTSNVASGALDAARAAFPRRPSPPASHEV